MNEVTTIVSVAALVVSLIALGTAIGAARRGR